MNRPSERGSVTRSIRESGGALRVTEPRSKALGRSATGESAAPQKRNAGL